MPDDIHLADLGDDSDEALMLAYASNQAGAFDVLYARHKDAVYRFFLRQHGANAQDNSVAEELCHDCWMKIIKHRHNYQHSAKFTTWLYTIARHTAMDFYQKKHLHLVETGHNLDDEEGQQGHVTLSDGTEQQRLQQALQQAIALLPLEQRQIFLLKQEGDFTLDEIADITQEKKEKVKSSWRYALQKLRKGLGDYV